uniref:SMP-LTD domain-containing protein n=2 Tax=Clastoptera arizonana TaxID=38151 RepID=A0A1B6CIT3_9HEMI
MANSQTNKGKSMQLSSSNISIRYYTEDEQLEELYDTVENKLDLQSDESCTLSSQYPQPSSNTTENQIKSSGVLSRFGKRSISLETPIQETKETPTGDTWRLLKEVRSKITKTVEDKIEEIKSERLKNHQNKRKKMMEQLEHSSVSDSEDASESSISLEGNMDKKDMSTINNHNNSTIEADEHSQESSEERSVTPSFVQNEQENCNKEEAIKMKKAIPNVKDIDEPIRKESEKTKKNENDEMLKVANERKKSNSSHTTMSYSKLSQETDDEKEAVEVAAEACEIGEDSLPSYSCSPILKSTAEFSNTLQNQILNFMSKWSFALLPLSAVFFYYIFEQSKQVLAFMLGSIATIMCINLFKYILNKLDWNEPAGVRLNMIDHEIFSSKPKLLLQSSNYRKPPEFPDKIKYEGWMNHFTKEYKPEKYHISLTKSVHIRLVGSKLSLAYPRNKVAKRAMWNEAKPIMQFNSIHTMDIFDCKVSLLPHGLIHRRRWSKKYPICIKLKPTSNLGVRIRSKDQATVEDDNFKVDLNEEYITFESNKVEESDECEKPTQISEEDALSCLVTDSDYIDSKLLETSFYVEAKEEEENNDDSDEEFVKVPMIELVDNRLYLFARTDHEKEIWFRRFRTAVTYPGDNENNGDKIQEALNSQQEKENKEREYLEFLHRLAQREPPSLPSVKQSNSKSSSKIKGLSISPDLMWLNLFYGRILYDVLKDCSHLSKIQEKIQRKMSAIKLPFFMEQLVISHIDFGKNIPIMQHSSEPTINNQGVWVDLDIIYEGGFKMTVDTKFNLMKLKAPNSGNEMPSDSPTNSPIKTENKPNPGTPKLAVFNSDIEDSAESSSEEPDLSKLQPAYSGNSPAASGRYMRFFHSVTQSTYFQHVTDYRVIRNMMEGLSNKNITLIVEVQGLVGTLVLNLPPPPTNRLWYGFRSNPSIWISATPKFGETTVTLLNITRFIEKKLCKEFEKLLVIPNMDDLIIPIMSNIIPS